MKLSLAIELGRMTVEEFEMSNLDKCVLGMAANAVGITRTYPDIQKEWPWLKNIIKPTCYCYPGIEITGLEVIWHIFDIHIMDERDKTLDQLIEWIKSVEPEETEIEITVEKENYVYASSKS